MGSRGCFQLIDIILTQISRISRIFFKHELYKIITYNFAQQKVCIIFLNIPKSDKSVKFVLKKE
jgi:NADH dehydrogenase FAD-containing subunit